MTSIFDRYRQRASVRRCQLLLGAQLRRDYGAGACYTPGQVSHAMRRAKLPPGDFERGCAAFMTEQAFDAAHPMPRTGYAQHREMLRRHAIAQGISGFEPAGDNLDAWAGAPWP